MGTTLTTADAFLREYYDGRLESALNNELPLYNRLDKVTEKVENVGGKSMAIRFAIKTQRNHGIGARAEAGTLPTAYNVAGQQAVVSLKYLYGRIQLTGQSIKASKQSKAAFVSQLEHAMEDMEDGMMVDFGRIIHGDGTGFLATISGTFNNTINVTVDGPDTRWLEPGMIVDTGVKTAATALVNTTVTISDVDPDNHAVKFSAALTVADNTYIFRNGSRNNEPLGLLGIVDDGTVVDSIYGLTRSTAGNNFLKGRLVSGGGDSLTESDLVTALQESTRTFYGGGNASIAVCDMQSMRYLAKIFAAKQRLVDAEGMNGGFTSIRYVVGSKAVTFLEDRYAYPLYIYFLNEKKMDFCFAPDSRWRWMDEDGAILSRVSNTDAYEATMFAYVQMRCRHFGSQVRLYNYTEPA